VTLDVYFSTVVIKIKQQTSQATCDRTETCVWRHRNAYLDRQLVQVRGYLGLLRPYT